MADDTRKLLLQRLAKGLRTVLNLNEHECYVVDAPAYVEGQAEKVIQVWGGGMSPEMGGNGGQEGGFVQRVAFLNLTLFLRIHMDIFGQSEQAMIREGGLTDFIESVNEVLELTMLGEPGELINAPIEWLGEYPPTWVDESVVRVDINYKAVWSRRRTTTITLTAAQCT